MGEAFFRSAVGASSLLIGALAAYVAVGFAISLILSSL
jgi:hypothetical protein